MTKHPEVSDPCIAVGLVSVERNVTVGLFCDPGQATRIPSWRATDVTSAIDMPLEKPHSSKALAESEMEKATAAIRPRGIRLFGFICQSLRDWKYVYCVVSQ